MEKLPRLARLFLEKRIYRVLLMGVISVMVQSILFATLGLWFAVVRPSTAALISTEIGLLVNFYLNNRFSFGDRSHAPLLTLLFRFHVTVTGSFFCQWLLVFTTEHLTTNPYALLAAYITGVLIGFILNYTGYRLWVWRHHEPPQL
jgi:putative flippase GtrA